MSPDQFSHVYYSQSNVPDNYELFQTISRIAVGSGLILLSALDVNASDDVLSPTLQYQGSRIWFLATHGWVYVHVYQFNLRSLSHFQTPCLRACLGDRARNRAGE